MGALRQEKHWSKYFHCIQDRTKSAISFLSKSRKSSKTKSDPKHKSTKHVMFCCIPIRIRSHRSEPMSIDQKNSNVAKADLKKQEIPLIFQENIKKAKQDCTGCVQVYRVHRSNENMSIFHSNPIKKNTYAHLKFWKIFILHSTRMQEL